MSDYSEALNFESLKFNPFDSSEEILTDKSFDPDLNFLIAILVIWILLMSHMKKIRIEMKMIQQIRYFTFLHFFRSIKKNFENLKLFLYSFVLTSVYFLRRHS